MSFQAHAAFFYPQDSKDITRRKRAKLLGFPPPPNEYDIVKTTKPLFEGHDQPRVYALTKDITTWEDSDPKALGLQVELAQDAGLTCFFMDTHVGVREKKYIKEFLHPVNELIKLETLRLGKFTFANFVFLGSSRVQFPLAMDRDGTAEPHRDFDLSLETARYIINIQKQYWIHPGHLYIKKRPVLGIMLPKEAYKKSKKNPLGTIHFLHELKRYSYSQYKIIPYLVGILTSHLSISQLVPLFEKGEMDALTNYAFLPDFSHNSLIQDYDSLVTARIADWNKVKTLTSLPYWPSAVTGWDATPRGPQNVTQQQIHGVYPFHPIVHNTNSTSFGRMFHSAVKLIDTTCSKEEKVSMVCAWNEIGEGMTLLPRLKNNILDRSFLDTYKRILYAYFHK